MSHKNKNNNYRRNNNRKNKRTKQDNDELKEKGIDVINKIKRTSYWANYKIEDIAKYKDGDAYIVADALIHVDNYKINDTQLRKFYNEVLDGYIALTSSTKQDIEKARTVLAMITPRAHYARERRNFGDFFLDFIKASCDLSKFRFNEDEKLKQDYKRFIQFFEALVGYHKYLKKIGKGK